MSNDARNTGDHGIESKKNCHEQVAYPELRPIDFADDVLRRLGKAGVFHHQRNSLLKELENQGDDQVKGRSCRDLINEPLLCQSQKQRQCIDDEDRLSNDE